MDEFRDGGFDLNIEQGFIGCAAGAQVEVSGYPDSMKARIALCAAKIGGCDNPRDILNRAAELLQRINPAVKPWRRYAALIKQRDLYGYDFSRAFADASASKREGSIGNAMIAVDGLNGNLPVGREIRVDAIGRNINTTRADDVRRKILGLIDEGCTTVDEICARAGLSSDHTRKLMRSYEAGGYIKRTVEGHAKIHIWSLA